MPTTPFFLCPICSNPLEKQDKIFKCENNHSFDCAKEGYVNLLPVQNKKTKQPGDNKAMIMARKFFLEKKHYDILLAPCTKLINKYLSTDSNPASLLDIGCGDGYFTNIVFNDIERSRICYGMDISKEAVKVAAKRDKMINWFVASSSKIPLPDESIDCILKINSPLDYANTAKKLSNNGFVVSITPGKKHLFALKSHIYETAHDHEPETQPANYKLLDTVNLEDTITLQNQNEIEQLFMMTPLYWNASQTAKNSVTKLTELTTEIAFDIHIWQKSSSETS